MLYYVPVIIRDVVSVDGEHTFGKGHEKGSALVSREIGLIFHAPFIQVIPGNITHTTQANVSDIFLEEAVEFGCIAPLLQHNSGT